MMKNFLFHILLAVSLFANIQIADDVGFVDDITINGREFESLEQQRIEFYPEDLQDGRVVIQGLLESQDSNTKAKALTVQISTNGGKSWNDAIGHEDWEYSFEPKIGYVYDFSLRIVKKTNDLDNIDQLISREFYIAGFKLTTDQNLSISGNQISGSGYIEIPYLSVFDLSNEIPVDFENLTFDANNITVGEIEYTGGLVLDSDVATIDLSKIKFTPNIENCTLEGSVNLNGFLEALPSINLAQNSKIKTNSFHLEIPINSQEITIWTAKGVKLGFDSGNLAVDYQIGNLQPTFDMNGLNAHISFGSLLTTAQNSANALEAQLSDLADTSVYTLQTTAQKAYILGKNLSLENFQIDLDISNFDKPKINWESSIDFSNFGNNILKSIPNATINAQISEDGFDASITLNSGLQPITILNRGSQNKNVSLSFDGEILPTFTVSIEDLDSTPKIGVSNLSAQIDFGDILQKAKNEAQATVNSIKAQLIQTDDLLQQFSLNFQDAKAYVMGTDLAIENFIANFDLNEMSLSLSSSINLEDFDNPIFQGLNGSLFDATITKNGFSANVIADGGLDPVVLLDRGGVGKDVRLLVDGTPSVGVSVNTSGVEFSFEELEAEVDFGDVLQTAANQANGAIQSARASLQAVRDTAGAFTLEFENATSIYLMGKSINLSQLNAQLNINQKMISLGSTLRVTNSDNMLYKLLDKANISASISPSGFSSTLNFESGLEPITILDRGAVHKNVRVEFTQMPTIALKLLRDDVDISVSGGEAQLSFGDLLNDAKAQLTAAQTESKEVIAGAYNWSISGSKKIMNDVNILLSELNGTLNMNDMSNPLISLNAKMDLSQYSGLFSSLTAVNLQNSIISKEGWSADIAMHINSVDIWKPKNVKLEFLQDPVVNLKITKSDFDLGFSNINANLHFGTLLQNSVAHIGGGLSGKLDEVKNSAIQSASDLANKYSWSIDGIKKLSDTQIAFGNLSGYLDLADISDPKILVNADVDLRQYASIFSTINSVELQDAVISKNGFEGDLGISLDNLPIWPEKNVSLDFTDRALVLNLALTSSKLNLGVKEFNGSLNFGSLLHDATATVNTLESGIHNWVLSGKHQLNDTAVSLSALLGSLDLSDLSDPKINLNGLVDLSGYSDMLHSFNEINISGAVISKDGFQADLSVNLEDINIWNAKQVKVAFADGTSPILHLEISRDDFNIGLSKINADLHFGQLLDGEIISLRAMTNPASEIQRRIIGLRNQFSRRVNNLPGVPEAQTPDFSCMYQWNLANSHNLITDENGTVTVTQIGGVANLCDLSDPKLEFDATANFEQYHIANTSLGIVQIDDAKISKNGIEWNLAFMGASTEITILNLGAKEDDVRAELFNVDGSASSSGSAGIDSADGKLYFGALFDGSVDPINLHYENTEHYSFSTEQVFTYTKGDNSIELSGLSGTVRKVSGNWEVTLVGNSTIQGTLLSKIGVSSLSFSSLKVTGSGFSGDIIANFDESLNKSLFNGKVTLELNTIGLHIGDSIALTQLDGMIDLTALFDAATNEANKAKAALNFNSATKLLGFNFGTKQLTLNDNFLFSAVAGNISLDGFDNLNLGLTGDFAYKGIDNLSLSLVDFGVNNSGLKGSVNLNGSINSLFDVTGLALNNFGVTFGPTIRGNIGLAYSANQFLGSNQPFNISFDALISTSGIQTFSVDTSAVRSINISNFAQLSFSGIDVSPDFSNFEITLDGRAKPINNLFSASNFIELEGLKISKSGVSVQGGYIEFDVSGANTTLGGLDLSLERLGVGITDNKFYIGAGGSLSLGIAEAGAGLKLYSDGSLDVDAIEILVNTPTLTFGGGIAWYKDDPIFGNGFGTTTPLQLSLANMFSVKGEFKIGNAPQKGFYWMAKAQGGLGSAGISMGPINIYELGGGVAYNMNIALSADRKTSTFTPSGTNNVIVILTSLLGTPDLGYTWHGQLDLNFNSDGQIVMNGSTYILSARTASQADKDKRRIGGTITLGMSPASLHITAGAHIQYSVIELTAPNGAVDILFDPSEFHVFIGTDERAQGFNVTSALGNISVRVFGLTAGGYFMIDSNRLAFGANYTFDRRLSISVCCFCDPYLSLNASARADALIQYNPFFMDLGAQASLNLGVGCGDVGATVGADLALRMVAPDPTYLKVRASVRIPIYGRASFTTYFPERPSNSDLARSNANNDGLPNLLNRIDPFDYMATDISIVPKINIITAFPADGSKFDIGDMKKNIKIISLNPIAKSITVDVNEKTGYDMELKDLKIYEKSTGTRVVQRHYLESPDTMKIIPTLSSGLKPNTQYVVSGKAELKEYYKEYRITREGDEYEKILASDEDYVIEESEDTPISQKIVKTQTFEKEFTTKNDAGLGFNEIVDYIFPANLQNDVAEMQPIVIYYDEIVKLISGNSNNQLISRYSVEVLNAKKEPISGSFGYNEENNQPKSIFAPSQPLRVYHFCVNKTTGEIRETFLNNEGQYLNPFRGYRLDSDYEVEAPPVNSSLAPPGLSVVSLPNANIGRLVYTSEDSDGKALFDYYTNDTYNILIKDTANGQTVYLSSFKVIYNEVTQENRRRFDALKSQLEPSMVYHRNIGRSHELKFDVNNGLSDLGIMGEGIYAKLFVTLNTKDFDSETIETEIKELRVERDGNTVHSQKDEIVGLESALIKYYDSNTNQYLHQSDIEISEGGVYDTSGIDAAQGIIEQQAGFGDGPRPNELMDGMLGSGVYDGMRGGMLGGNVGGGFVGESMNLGVQF